MSTSPLEDLRTETSHRIVPRRNPGPTVSEPFVSLANRIIALREDPESHKAIGICGCGPRQGASTVANQLTAALAGAIEGRVLLVQTSPQGRHTKPAAGWLDLLQFDLELADVIEDCDLPGVSVLPVGNVDSMPRMAIDPMRLRTLVEAFKHHFEFVIFDLPAPGASSGCLPIASILDGVLLVVQAGRVNAAVATEVKSQLEQANAHVIGAVLNQQKSHVPRWLREKLPFGLGRRLA